MIEKKISAEAEPRASEEMIFNGKDISKEFLIFTESRRKVLNKVAKGIDLSRVNSAEKKELFDLSSVLMKSKEPQDMRKFLAAASKVFTDKKIQNAMLEKAKVKELSTDSQRNVLKMFLSDLNKTLFIDEKIK